MKTPRGLQAPSSKPGIGTGIGRGLAKSGGAAGTTDKVKKIQASSVQKKTVDAPQSIEVPGKFTKPTGTGIGGNKPTKTLGTGKFA